MIFIYLLGFIVAFIASIIYLVEDASSDSPFQLEDTVSILILATIKAILWPLVLAGLIITYSILKPLTKYFNQIQDRKREQSNEH